MITECDSRGHSGMVGRRGHGHAHDQVLLRQMLHVQLNPSTKQVCK